MRPAGVPVDARPPLAATVPAGVEPPLGVEDADPVDVGGVVALVELVVLDGSVVVLVV